MGRIRYAGAGIGNGTTSRAEVILADGSSEPLRPRLPPMRSANLYGAHLRREMYQQDRGT